MFTAFNERLLEARTTQLRLSQKEAAKRAGITETAWQNYEKGRKPKGDVLEQIAVNLGISIDWLLTGEGQMLRDQATPHLNDDKALSVAIVSVIRFLEDHQYQVSTTELRDVFIANLKTANQRKAEYDVGEILEKISKNR